MSAFYVSIFPFSIRAIDQPSSSMNESIFSMFTPFSFIGAAMLIKALALSSIFLVFNKTDARWLDAPNEGVSKCRILLLITDIFSWKSSHITQIICLFQTRSNVAANCGYPVFDSLRIDSAHGPFKSFE